MSLFFHDQIEHDHKLEGVLDFCFPSRMYQQVPLVTRG